MGLLQVSTNTVTSAVATVTLIGIDSDDVYMVAFNNVLPDTDTQTLCTRPTISGTMDAGGNKDFAYKILRAGASFQNTNVQNSDFIQVSFILGTGTSSQEKANGVMYLFNFNSTSENKFMTLEESNLRHTGELTGNQGGAVFKNSSDACDGLGFFFSSGNIASGTFTLYKVV